MTTVRIDDQIREAYAMNVSRLEDTAEREIVLQVSDVPDIPASRLMRSTYGIRPYTVRLEFESLDGAPWKLTYVHVHGYGLLANGKFSMAYGKVRLIRDSYRADAELMPAWLRRLALDWTPETPGTLSTEQQP